MSPTYYPSEAAMVRNNQVPTSSIYSEATPPQSMVPPPLATVSFDNLERKGKDSSPLKKEEQRWREYNHAGMDLFRAVQVVSRQLEECINDFQNRVS